MEQVIGASTKDPEKSEYLYGNEKMNTEQTTIQNPRKLLRLARARAAKATD